MKICKGLTQWALVPLCLTILKKYFTNMEISPTLLRQNTKNAQGIYPMGLCPCGMTLLFTTEKLSKHGQQKNMTFCWKDLDHSQNNCAGLTQWDFVPLGPTLNYTAPNLNT